MKAFVTQASRWMDRLVRLSSILGTLALIAVVLIILLDVLGRNLIGAPLAGAQDLAQMGMVIIVFGGVAICDRMNANVSVDILETWFPAALNRALDIVGRLIGAAFFVGIGVTVLESAELSRLLNLSTNILGLPKAHFQYAVIGFSFLTAASMLVRLGINHLTPAAWGLSETRGRAS